MKAGYDARIRAKAEKERDRLVEEEDKRKDEEARRTDPQAWLDEQRTKHMVRFAFQSSLTSYENVP